MERGVYNTNNQPKRANFKYEQEGQFYLGVAKVEGQYGTIIGKRCPVFDYTEKKIVILFAKYKREEVEIRHVPSCYDKPSFLH